LEEEAKVPELKLHVPTYNAGAFPNDVANHTRPEFGEPYVPVVVRPADGVRLVLGSHDYWNSDAPDIQIERRPRGWAIFLHPVGGSDPSGYVYFVDDGRSFVVPESGVATPAILMRTSDEAVFEVDGPSSTTAKSRHCEFCGVRLEACGDNWDDLCPECADFVSSYLDRRGLTDEYRDAAIEFLKTDPRKPRPSDPASWPPSDRKTRRRR
jgi:hypothetical protein